tara:strand:- start:1590 stop:2738 length:1149 start_codon:yes stop_codon:yes gene_type:complete
MSINSNWGTHVLLAFITVIFLLPFSSAGLVELTINNSDDLLVSEDEIIFQEGTNMDLYVRLKGDLRSESSDKYVESIVIKVHFRNDDDIRESLTGYPEFQALCDTCEDPGYDEYLSKFRGNDERFQGYEGTVDFAVEMKNNSGGIVWDDVLQITLQTQKTESGDSGGFSIPELPPAVEDNLIPIVIGLLVIIILSVGIYTFVLAPEDTTADLYKPVESIDPLKKSLTGVGHKSELPTEPKKLKRLEDSTVDSDEDEEEDIEDEYEDDFDDEEDDSDFDERKLLDELTGTHSISSKEVDEDDDEDEKPKAAPVKKKPIKKRVAKKGVAKKIMKRPSTKSESNEPDVSMGKGVKSIKCPSCAVVHNIDENTPKFICSCGRRIRT